MIEPSFMFQGVVVMRGLSSQSPGGAVTSSIGVDGLSGELVVRSMISFSGSGVVFRLERPRSNASAGEQDFGCCFKGRTTRSSLSSTIRRLAVEWWMWERYLPIGRRRILGRCSGSPDGSCRSSKYISVVSSVIALTERINSAEVTGRCHQCRLLA